MKTKAVELSRRYEVRVDDCPMQHGPIKDGFHLSRLSETVDCYRKINPQATITLTITETPKP